MQQSSYHENILFAIAESAEQLLRVDHWQTALDDILNLLGRSLFVERITIIQQVDVVEQTPVFSFIQQWTAAGSAKSLHEPRFQRFLFPKDTCPRWYQILISERGIVAGNTRDFLQAEQEYIRGLNIQSVAIAPVYVQGHFWGAISFAHLSKAHAWTEVELRALQSITAVLAAAIERDQTFAALKASENRFQLASKATDDLIYERDIQANSIRWNLDQLSDSKTIPRINLQQSWWQDAIHGDDRPRVVEAFTQAITCQQASLSIEYRLQAADQTQAAPSSFLTMLDRAYFVYQDNQLTRVIGCLQDITSLKQEQIKLAQSNDRLRHLASRLQEVREEERVMLARELHDQFAQVLTALKMDIAWFEQRLPKLPEPIGTDLAERAQAIKSIIDDTMNRVRTIATELRPTALDELGLGAAIEGQLADFADRVDCHYSTQCNVGELHIPKTIEVAVFRIFQEALTNIARHADATQILAQLYVENQQLCLLVQDNGRGIKSEQRQKKTLGLVSMIERAENLNGQADIHHYGLNDSHLGAVVDVQTKRLYNQGTRVFVSIPL